MNIVFGEEAFLVDGNLTFNREEIAEIISEMAHAWARVNRQHEHSVMSGTFSGIDMSGSWYGVFRFQDGREREIRRERVYIA